MLSEGILYYITFCPGEKKNITYTHVVAAVPGYLMFPSMKFLMLIVQIQKLFPLETKPSWFLVT